MHSHIKFTFASKITIGSLLTLFAMLPADVGIAQVIPDATLVTPSTINAAGDRIDGGVLRGSNLFHSFQRFDIGVSSSVYFNDRGASNIFSRVTGSAISNINGTLGVLGSANSNLFLINPNGIIFGPNAQLDLGGSFVATTASSVMFNKGGIFSASNPAASSILSIDAGVQAPIGLHFEGSARPISIQGAGNTLSLQQNKALALIGGDITIDNQNILAPSGKITLGAVAGDVKIDLLPNLDFVFPLNAPRKDISITNNSLVLSSGSPGGSVNLEGKSIFLLSGSQVGSNTYGGQGKGGNTTIIASDLVEIKGRKQSIDSAIQSVPTGTTAAGDIYIQAKRLIISDGGNILTTVQRDATGKGGNLIVKVLESIVLGSASANGFPSGLFSGTIGRGDAGELTVETGDLLIKDGGQIQSNNFEIGVDNTLNGMPGNISIFARNNVDVVGNSYISKGTDGRNLPSSIGTFTVNDKKAGDINIISKNFLVRDGASITSTTNGLGNSGTLKITASESVEIIGSSPEGKSTRVRNATLSGIGDNGRDVRAGNSNDLIINANRLIISDAGRIDSRTNTTGSGGNVFINVKDLVISGGGQIISTTNSTGKAGTVTVNATEKVNISGADSRYQDKINYLKQDGGVYDNTLLNENASSSIIASAKQRSTNEGGNIKIITPSLTLTDGGQLSVTTAGQKKAGDIQINALNSLTISGVNAPTKRISGLFASAESGSLGDGGGITANSTQLLISDGGQIASDSQGKGDGGDIVVSANRIDLNNGKIISSTSFANGGDIDLKIKSLLFMQNGSQISTNAGTIENSSAQGSGGNIFINRNRQVPIEKDIKQGFIIAIPNQNNDITANSFSNQGGKVEISVQRTFGITPRSRLDLETWWKENHPGQEPSATDLNPINLPTSDITAISQGDAALNGTVSIRPTIDPNQGLNQLPQEPRSTEVNDSCQVSSGKEAVKFFDIGRGGLAPRPEDPLSIDLLEWSSSPSPSSLSTQNLSIDKASQLPIDRPRFSSQATPSPKLTPPCQS